MAGPASVELCPEIPAPCGRLFRLVERDPRRAVAIARRWQVASEAAGPLEQAMGRYALGYTLLRWERLDEAEGLLDTAAARLRDLGAPRLALHARRARLFLSLLQGGGTGDSAEWAALAEAYRSLDDPLSAARVCLAQIAQLNLQGLAAEALRLAETARPHLEALGTPADRAWLARITGVTCVELGHLDLALARFDEAATLFQALRQRGELAKTMIERSHIYESYGNLAQCTAELERACRLARQIDLPLRVAFCTKNLGWFAALQGEYDRGIWLSLEAHEQLARLRRSDYLADCDLNLGNIAYFANLPDLALAAYRRAEEVYLALERRHAGLICRRNQALALRLSQQPQRSLELLDTLIPEARQLGSPVELAESIQARGRALVDLGRLPEATEAFEQAEQQFRAIGNLAGAGKSLLERGWLLLDQGATEQAEPCIRAARPLLHERPVHLWRIDYALGICAERRGKVAAALALYRRACVTVGRLRQRLANEHASSGLFAQARRLIDDAIGLAWREDEAAVVLELAELQRAAALTAALRTTQVESMAAGIGATGTSLGPSLSGYLEARLRNRGRRPLDEGDLLAPLDLPRLRAALERAFPAGWTLLAYVPCGAHMLIVTLDAATIALTATPLDERLRWLLERATAPRFRWLTYLESDAPEAGVASWPILAELGARLLPRAAVARLHPDQRLLIVAGSALHGLPWGALRVDGGWLVERATPQLLPGLHHWRELARRRPAGAAALSIGVANFDGRAPDLPGVSASLDVLAHRWPGPVRRLEGEAIGVEALLHMAAAGELRSYGLLHMATHGQLVPASGLLAHLKLADGDLHYDEIAQLNLSGALVVLAACEGAAVEVLPGEEVLSLSRAMLVAGARDVVASIWQLFDTVAPLLLDHLYAGLAEGLDVPTALARAQRAWLTEPADDPELAALGGAPLVWAGLCALGAGTAAP